MMLPLFVIDDVFTKQNSVVYIPPVNIFSLSNVLGDSSCLLLNTS